ncbi:hypothetical protein PVK06_026582 [Gossypium arboreum]|uniref:DUF4283 domain-containing protein n=1 Tax=Gossypium arboreum TaxID=29729 RepID=A0ABR0P0K2_GOSAR|nr:hypothetical protein PVK06_026582 [Gossypium arboreum]
MANLWHLVRGVQVSDLGEKRFLFRFFHKMDLKRVVNGTYWTFNNHLLIIHRLVKEENPLKADLPQELTSTERFGTSGGLANSGPRNLEWRCRWGFRGIQITSGIFNSPKHFVAYYALPRLWVPRYPP